MSEFAFTALCVYSKDVRIGLRELSHEGLVANHATKVTKIPGNNRSVALEEIVDHEIVEDIKHTDPGRRIRLEVALAGNYLRLDVMIVLVKELPPVDCDIYAAHFVQCQ